MYVILCSIPFCCLVLKCPEYFLLRYYDQYISIDLIYQKLPSEDITFLSCDIESNNNIYSVLYRGKGKFVPIVTKLLPLNQDKFGWNIKVCHLRILPTSHVTFTLNIIFLAWFIGRWAGFYPFWPPFLPPYAPETR